MQVNINSNILTENTIKNMEELIKKSKETGKEHGSVLCQEKDKKELNIGEECIGRACTVNIPMTCKKDDIIKGDYHTHPTATAYPAILDLASSYFYGIGCIGSVIDNKIKCYSRLNSQSLNTYNKIDNIHKNVEIPVKEQNKKVKDSMIKYGHASSEHRKEIKKYNEMFEIWKKERDKILDEHFKIINVK